MKNTLIAAKAPERAKLLDPAKFGPWALVTGASSGIGKEFARQLAAHGIHVVLASRRLAELESVGRQLAERWGVEFRAVEVDFTKGEPLDVINAATRDLDVGLVISNAGDAQSGEFLADNLEDLRAMARVNVLAHLDLAHHFGRRLAIRQRGGLLLVGALGASEGVPYMAHTGATKAYIHSLGQALHIELAKQGISVTVLMPGTTDTPVQGKLGIENPPMKLMPVEQCVSEALRALNANRATIIPGRLIRLMVALVPASVMRGQTAKMFDAVLKRRRSSAGPSGAGKTL